jgi:hypothetical protein
MVPELISMLGGGLVGFIFRFMAEKRQDQKEMFNRLLQLNNVQQENYDKAAKRVPLDIGKGIRQLIVLTVLFAALCAPFVLPFFGLPTFVEIDVNEGDKLFGLIGGSTSKVFVEINGYLYSSELRQILVSIVGFYFGSSAASNKN